MDTNSFAEIFAKAQNDPRFWEEMAILEFTESVTSRLGCLNFTRTDLATKMGVSPAFITKLMCGKNNFTLRTMVKVAQSLGCELAISLVPAASHIQPLRPDNESILRFPAPATSEVGASQEHFEVVPSVIERRLTDSGRTHSPQEHADLALAA